MDEIIELEPEERPEDYHSISEEENVSFVQEDFENITPVEVTEQLTPEADFIEFQEQIADDSEDFEEPSFIVSEGSESSVTIPQNYSIQAEDHFSEYYNELESELNLLRDIKSELQSNNQYLQTINSNIVTLSSNVNLNFLMLLMFISAIFGGLIVKAIFGKINP